MSRKKVKVEPTPEELFLSIAQDESTSEQHSGLDTVLTNLTTLLKDLQNQVAGLSTKMDNAIRMLSELEVKTDTIGQRVNAIENVLSNRGAGSVGGEPTTSNLLQRPFKKVASVKDLESLDSKCQDPDFVENAIKFFGAIHGQGRFMGNGGTVCLQLFDSFFDRVFMLSCSWTGAGKNQKKIPFLRFEKVINLFFRVVQYSDPSFTLDQTQIFLHRCLRNATQRVKESSGKKATSRKRKSRAGIIVAVEESEDYIGQVEEEQEDEQEEEYEREDERVEDYEQEDELDDQAREEEQEDDHDEEQVAMKIEILHEEML